MILTHLLRHAIVRLKMSVNSGAGGKVKIQIPLEAVHDHTQVDVQYEDRDIKPFIIDRNTLKMTVDQMKRGLLELQIMDFVDVPADELEMYLLLPHENVDEDDILKKMEPNERMSNYYNDLSRCKMIKMMKPVRNTESETTETTRE